MIGRRSLLGFPGFIAGSTPVPLVCKANGVGSQRRVSGRRGSVSDDREFAMRIKINGQPETVECDASVGDLLLGLKLEPIRVAVEINEELVPRKTFAETLLKDGDRVEIVTLVGGG